MDNILVSISCITYNHEKYISDAIEGFLLQKTNFQYEILIHDDASTDRTTEIIKQYEYLYPEVIKPIYQEENQYSKGVKIECINRERAKGKYIAICEGDDFWTDPYKLQKQIDYMESHNACTLCFHKAEIVKANKKSTGKFEGPNKPGNNEYYIDSFISLGFIPTASFVFRKNIMDNPPDWYMEAVVGDLPLSLICTYNGYAYYIDEAMSAYRTGVKGSIMDTWAKKYSREQKINLQKGYIKIWNSFNQYSNFKFSKQIERAKLKSEFEIKVIEGNIKKIINVKYKDVSFKLKVILLARHYFPKSYRKIIYIKHNVLNFN